MSTVEDDAMDAKTAKLARQELIAHPKAGSTIRVWGHLTERKMATRRASMVEVMQPLNRVVRAKLEKRVHLIATVPLTYAILLQPFVEL